MATQPIKYGQIGTGHGHASKTGVYRKSPDFEVVGIVEPDPELRRRAERNSAFQGLAWMSQEQLLNTPGLQVVGVETRVQNLLDTAEACLQAGKHIHLDKPAGESLPQFERILDTAARKHLAVQMGYMYRYNPAVVMLREFLDKGWLGEPFEIRAVMSKVVSPEARGRLARFSGGMMFELGCHLIDLVVGLAGEPESVHSFSQHASTIDDGLADNMLAVFEYPNVLASVKSSAMEVEGFARRHLVVCGSEGTFHIQPLDAPSVRFALSRGRGQFHKGYQDKHFGRYERYVADAADLAKIIRGEKTPDYSYAYDLGVQRTVLKASGMTVE
jgi:predicted dehydrogenase